MFFPISFHEHYTPLMDVIAIETDASLFFKVMRILKCFYGN